MREWVKKNWPKEDVNIWIDNSIMMTTFFLCIFGLLMVASASMDFANKEYDDAWYFIKRQGIYLCLGLVVGVGVYLVSSNFWYRLTIPMFFIVFILLIGLLLFGNEINGSKRWIHFGITFQPSELAKLACILFIANYISRHEERLRQTTMGFIIPICIIALLIVIPILFQPDYGTAAIILITVSSMLFLAGVKWHRFLSYMTFSVTSMAIVAISAPYRWNRIQSFLNPWQDPYDGGYQLTQSLIAIGSNSWFGVGLGNSVQKQFYLPEAHTDFIFSIITEELGLIAAVVIMFCFLLLVWRCFSIADSALKQNMVRESFISYGIGISLCMQGFFHIAVAVGSLPTKGLPLPLISVGGSNLIVTFIAIAIIQRIYHEVCCSDPLLMRRYREGLQSG